MSEKWEIIEPERPMDEYDYDPNPKRVAEREASESIPTIEDVWDEVCTIRDEVSILREQHVLMLRLLAVLIMDRSRGDIEHALVSFYDSDALEFLQKLNPPKE